MADRPSATPSSKADLVVRADANDLNLPDRCERRAECQINLVPLESSLLIDCKSNIKWLEASARVRQWLQNKLSIIKTCLRHA